MPNKTPPVKVDPRVKRTRRLLRDALVSLILEKDFASITIREITERAGVAYITFFRQFESIDQLLMEVYLVMSAKQDWQKAENALL